MFAMKKLFYVEQDQILRNGMIAIASGSSWDMYVLDSMEDFGFRLEDYKPDLLLIDVTLCTKKLDVTTQIPVVYLGFPHDFEKADFIVKSDLKLVKPIQVSKVLDQLKGFLDR